MKEHERSWNDIDKEKMNYWDEIPVLEPLRPLQTTWTGLASNPGLRCERQATNRLSHYTDDPFLLRAYTRVLSHVALHRVVMLYEATLLTYINTLWHFLFLNYHSKSAQKARCFRHGRFYCPVLRPLLNTDILSWLKCPCCCVRWLMWESEWSIRPSGVRNSHGTPTNLQTSCMYPHSVGLAP